MLKVLEIALGEVGYLEKASNADLDSKTGNAGWNNYTKYARDLDALGDFYNTPKQGYEWCEVFVDWCFYEAYGKATALNMLYQPRKSAGAGCTQSAQYYKDHGAFYHTPQVGDQVYFSWGGEPDHTGLVYAVDSKRIYTVEGNTSGKSGLVPNGGGVFRKEYPRSYANIYGYGRPNYSLVEDLPSSPSEPINDEGDDYVTVKLRVLMKGMAGTDVRTMQRLLAGSGYGVGPAGCDGDFGNDTRAALMRFQLEHSLVADGICGAKTWPALLGV